MLQFSLKNNAPVDILSQARMAIEAGCQWLELDTDTLSENDIDAIAPELIEMCREEMVILTFTRRHDIVDRLRVHGVMLLEGDATPASLRDSLGGHPIIGVSGTPDIPLSPLKQADVDYIVLHGYPASLTLDQIATLRQRQEEAGILIPIVVEGNITPGDIPALVAAGAQGLKTDYNSLQGPSREASLKSLLNACH